MPGVWNKALVLSGKGMIPSSWGPKCVDMQILQAEVALLLQVYGARVAKAPPKE